MSETVRYSVIIPVYNRENTLARCLDSLIAQRRSDVQIVVVDDGSCDRSAEISREYAARFSTIQYHFQENAGVSQARNTGLSLAVGEYITFVDSDDYVSLDYFEILDRAVANSDWDLLVFQKCIADDPESDESELFTHLTALPDSFQRLKYLLSTRLIMPPVTKCFKRDIIRKHHLEFMKGFHIGEDFCFSMSYALLCSQISMEQARIYYVDTADENSLSRKYRPDLTPQITGVFRHIEERIRNSCFVPEQREELLAIADYLFVKNICSCIVEGFKVGKLQYYSNRKEIASICQAFLSPISSRRCGIVHTVMRLFLKWNWYFPFYGVSILTKGHRYLRKH